MSGAAVRSVPTLPTWAPVVGRDLVPDASPRGHRVVVVLVALAAGAWAVTGLASRSLSSDEAFVVGLASGRARDAVAVVVSREPFMAVQQVLLRPWILAAGSTAVAVRLVSVLAFVSTILVVHRIGVRLLGPRSGIVAATSTAVHGTLLVGARDAGGVSLAAALVAVSALALVRLEQDAGATVGSRRWIEFVGVTAVAGYTAPSAPVVAIVVIGIVAALDRARRRTLLLGAGAVLVMWLPIAVHLVRGAARFSGWFAAAAQQVSLGPRLGSTLVGGTAAWQTVLVAVTVLVLVVAWVRRRVLTRWVGTDLSVPLIVAWATGPLAIGLLVGVVVPIMTPEFVAVSAPAVALGLTAVLRYVAGPRLALAAAAVALLVLSTAATTLVARAEGSEADWRAAADLLVSRGTAGDHVVVEPRYDTFALGYAIQETGRADRAPRPVGAPSWTELPVAGPAPTLPSGSLPAGTWLVGGRGRPGTRGVEVDHVRGLEIVHVVPP